MKSKRKAQKHKSANAKKKHLFRPPRSSERTHYPQHDLRAKDERLQSVTNTRHRLSPHSSSRLSLHSLELVLQLCWFFLHNLGHAYNSSISSPISTVQTIKPTMSHKATCLVNGAMKRLSPYFPTSGYVLAVNTDKDPPKPGYKWYNYRF